MNKIYNLLDEIYCINLIHRTDRYISMKKLEKEENIKITYYRPEKHIKGGTYGCFNSQIEVIKMAYNKKHKYIMIFEDDTIRTNSYNKINIDEIIKLFKSNKWDIIKFSCGIINILQLFNLNEYNNIYKGGTVCNNAYILNNKSYYYSL
jgi:GR25 family glycosyltransferase involved in LPS biosynthesis